MVFYNKYYRERFFQVVNDIKAKLCDGISVYRDGFSHVLISEGAKFEKCIHLLWKHYSKSVEEIQLVQAHTQMAKGQNST